MSRDVRGKIAAGQDLDAADIKYARERGIPLPRHLVEDPDVVVEEPEEASPESESIEEVTAPTEEETADASEDAAEDSSEEEEETVEVDMDSMSKAELVSLGEQLGLELSKRSSKKELMEAIAASQGNA